MVLRATVLKRYYYNIRNYSPYNIIFRIVLYDATVRSVSIRNLSSGHTTHDLKIRGHEVSAKTVRSCVCRKFARPGEKKIKIKRYVPLRDNNAKRETYFENDYCAQTSVFFFSILNRTYSRSLQPIRTDSV